MQALNTVEISQLDLRYESLRMKHPKQEERLLLSILKRGIRDPLRGVCIKDTHCLLDGFKRVRCARRLAIATVPYHSLGNDEALGIIELMRESFSGGLHVIEQIKLIEALKSNHGLSNREIAEHLGKSAAWVSIRVEMNRKMTPTIATKILSGKFPARSYLYTILPLTRVKPIQRSAIEQFIECVSGNNLTTREIDRLAQSYFDGGVEIKEQIEQGNVKWLLQTLDTQKKDGEPGEELGCTDAEQAILKGLKMVRAGMVKTTRHLKDPALKSAAFFAQANLLTQRILQDADPFLDNLRSLYDRSG